MIRALYRHQSGSIIPDLSTDQLSRAVKDRSGRLWIDMQAPTEDEIKLVLEEMLRFHPLTIEDVVNSTHVPKLDDYDSYLFLILHTLGLGDERMDIHTYEIDVYLGSTWLITIHAESRDTIERLWSPAFHAERGLARGPAYLLYEILDHQIDGYIPLLEGLDERLEELGDLIFQIDEGHTEQTMDEQSILNELLTAKSSALRLRRILSRQRELVSRLSTAQHAVIPHEMRIFFSDVYDHLLRLDGMADSIRDLASATIATHLALINNRTNEVMKVLTVIGSIFLPLTFLAGIYGMNFRYMPELAWPWAYGFVWLVFIGVIVGMIWWFKRRRWL